MTIKELTADYIYFSIVGKRMVAVQERMFNSIVVIGPANMPFLDDQW